MTSVLVSVYNAEGTLRRCLDSLLAQTNCEVQIICIDDASTDNSPSILQEYASLHNNIDLVFLPENHGQGFARNQGIPLIKGEYTAFLDSDDYLDNDTLERAEKVFRTHEETDCVVLNVQYIYPDGTSHSYRTPPFDVMKGFDAFKASLTWDVHGWYIARSELYRKYPFDDSCHSYSDDNTTMEHYLHSREVRWCDARYYFVQHDDSCTHGVTMRRYDWLRANENLHKKLILWGMPADIINLYEAQRYYNLLDTFRFFLRHESEYNKEEQSIVWPLLRHIWRSIGSQASIPLKVRLKPFYMRLRPFWRLFVLQQYMYVKIFG